MNVIVIPDWDNKILRVIVNQNLAYKVAIITKLLISLRSKANETY